MNELATVRANAQQLNEMVTQAAANYHETIFLRVVDGRVDTLMQTNGRQVVSYCTFDGGFFDEVSGDASALIPVGGSSSDQKGFLDYMQFAGDGKVEITFLNDDPDKEDERAPNLATYWQAEGALNTKLRLPGSAEDLNAVPWSHPFRWTEGNEYASKSSLNEDGRLPEDEDDVKTPSTTIETTANAVREHIISPVDFADGVENYPITVSDGEFVVNIEGKSKDDAIWGEVRAELVEGPDVDRLFDEGFPEIFDTIDGHVRLQTSPEPDDPDAPAPPITIVRDHREHVEIRHLVGAVVG